MCPTAIKAAIRDKALALGFDAVGFAPAVLAAEAGERLATFLAAGQHGEMGWLAERSAERASPQALWEGAKAYHCKLVRIEGIVGHAREQVPRVASAPRYSLSLEDDIDLAITG